MARRWRQLGLLPERKVGGRPKGRRTVSRVSRPLLSGREPLHVTLRLRSGLPPLRRHHLYRTLRAAFRRGRERFGFRLIHYSVQSNHIHLICEAEDRRALARGIQGLAIRIARGVNRVAKRTGKLFGDRYHLSVLTTPRQVRNALIYVLRNGVRHGESPPGPWFDLYSSALFFEGWKEKVTNRYVTNDDSPVVPAHRWLLTTGWKRHGLISLEESPAPGRPPM